MWILPGAEGTVMLRVMWKPALFLITILGVTESGRAAVTTFANWVITRLTEEAPTSYFVAPIVVGIALLCVLLMRDWRSKRPEVYSVWREIRYGKNELATDERR